MPMQHLRRSKHLVKRGLAVFRYAKAVVQFQRSINAEADEKAMFLEEQAPLVVEQRPVRLEIVLDSLPRLLVLLLKFNHLLEELQPEQARFATLPGKDHLIAVLPLDVLLDVGFENLVGNAELA